MGLRSLVRKLVGHDQWRPIVARPDSMAALRLSYLAFKDLITSNDELLELIADIEQKLEGGTPFDMRYVRLRAVACATHTYRIILCLDKLSSRRYQALQLVFSSIQRAIEPLLSGSPSPDVSAGPLTCRLSDLDATRADAAGGKAANVGEVKNRAHLPVPDGFVISTAAFTAFLSHDQFGEAIRTMQVGLEADDQQNVDDISRALRHTITAQPVPAPVERAILAAYDELSERLGSAPMVSMRSSAVGEDGEVSFAGQYVSVLNVSREGLIDAYREVVAGLYTPRALFSRSVHGIPDAAAMAVLCMAQVNATASGVACSVDPSRPEAGTLLITGAWGLGITVVGGSVSPDVWEVSKAGGTPILSARLGVKNTRAEAKPEGGVDWAVVSQASASSFCLSETQVAALAKLVLVAETHYGRPQELEWALDPHGRLFILQCRPARVARQARPREGAAGVQGHKVLVTGASASSGCAAGPVFHLAESDDAAGFPAGAVLVARHSSPTYVRVMDRAVAIVTDIGATTGHMALLARELNVPAVLDTQTATVTLAPGQIVTVDANTGLVYDGRVESLLAVTPPAPARTMRETPVFHILRQVADRVVPLNLTEPRSQTFRPENCLTFHDITRFAHEKAFEEMFRMSDGVADVTNRAVKLAERLPYELYLIDIGGGLQPRPAGASDVSAGDVLSEPMRALLDGMMNPALRWWEPRNISFSGFLAVTTESMMSPRYETERQLGDRSYAIVAEGYCNFSSRIGYHFAAVDAYCSESLTRNYVSFRFKGGAADDARRAKRCALIGEILKKLDFQIEGRGDLVNARLRKYPKETILDRLDLLGRLIVATRQLDMRMGRDAPIDWFVRAFFAGNYVFDPRDDSTAVGGQSTQ